MASLRAQYLNKTKNIFDPPLRRVRPKVNSLVTPLYLKSWTLLDFHTWHVYTPPKWQEQALANIFSTILEARVRNQLGVVYISFSASNKKHEFYITGCHKDSSFQQRKLESFNMYIYIYIYISKVIKLTNVSWNTPPIIITCYL